VNNDNTDPADLIERSSLGAEGARLLRQRAPKERVESVVAAAHERPNDVLGTLVEAAVDGNPYARQAVLRWIRPLVLRYCRARVGGQGKMFASAEDVAQEVCLAVLTALPSYRDHGRPFLSFVYGIASHKVAEAHRNAARNRADLVLELPDTPELADGPEAQVLSSELTGRMAKLLHNMPERQREVLILRVVIGLSLEETAEAVGSTPGAVRVATHRALNRLRNLLTARARSDHFVREQGGPEAPPEQFTAQEWDMELSDDEQFTAQEWDMELSDDDVFALQMALAGP
jgi:RNA polymerase sigma-70 factor (ECF subfamily)